MSVRVILTNGLVVSHLDERFEGWTRTYTGTVDSRGRLCVWRTRREVEERVVMYLSDGRQVPEAQQRWRLVRELFAAYLDGEWSDCDFDLPESLEVARDATPNPFLSPLT